MAPPVDKLAPYLRRQDGVITLDQGRAVGMTSRQLRTLLSRGWTQPTRGILVEPAPRDPFRSSLRAALLAHPGAAVCGISAARLFGLWGLPLWSPAELPQLLLPPGSTPAQRKGMHLRYCRIPAERTWRGGFPVTCLGPTVNDLSAVLALDDLVCLLESAMHEGWSSDARPSSAGYNPRLRAALKLADARSESPLETVIRLLLTRAGLAPETLQLRLFTHDGVCYARLDMAWPSRKVALEADGRQHHDAPDALYRDRVRQNDVLLDGWTVLRFTWTDRVRHPDQLVAKVRQALGGEGCGKSSFPGS